MLAASDLLAFASVSAPAAMADDFHYGADTVDIAAHWAGRPTLASAVMFSGLGEPLPISMSTADDLLKHAGYVTRPPMPAMALVGAVHPAATPRSPPPPDPSPPRTLRRDPGT